MDEKMETLHINNEPDNKCLVHPNLVQKMWTQSGSKRRDT